jgi:long-chain acyl-CoA synthetase
MQYVKGADPVPVDPAENLTTTLWRQAQAAGSFQILRYPSAEGGEGGGGWSTLTWSQFAERVRGIAAGLIALGIEPGDRVALMSSTRLEWTLADYAILAAGAVTVPLYETSSVAQCEWVLSDSGAKVALAGTSDHAKNLDAARSAAPDLGEIFVFDDGGLDALAERAGDEHPAIVDQRVEATGTDKVASLIYTSGTTGNPKGCILTHGNLLSTARQSKANLRELFESDDASTLLFLPLAHVFARIIQYGCLESGAQLGFARSVETLIADLATFKPTFLLAVPRVFDKVFNTAQRNAQGAKARVFGFAVSAAQQWSRANAPGPLVNARRALADRLVYSKFRAALGGNVRYCISGGAPLALHLAHFFHAAGITILEGYGLTETSAAASVNTPRRMKIGTVGQPIPGVEFRIADDGEIQIRGAGVFQGYYHDDAATREVLSEDGWFASGDIGELDDEGYLTITGRKKELIVTAGGKNVAPAVLEERLKAHRLVSQAMVVGDNRPFVAALITLDPDELTAFAAQRGLPGSTAAEVGRHETLLAELDEAVAHANQAVSKAESIRKFTVLERDFSMEEGELTLKLSMRRNVIAQNFADHIEGIYTR